MTVDVNNVVKGAAKCLNVLEVQEMSKEMEKTKMMPRNCIDTNTMWALRDQHTKYNQLQGGGFVWWLNRNELEI